MKKKTAPPTYWETMRSKFFSHRLGRWGLYVIILFGITGIYAPFLASSKPLFVLYDGTPYFPLFRYLFYQGFFTKHLDIFFNILIFTFPLTLIAIWWTKNRPNLRFGLISSIIILQLVTFFYFGYFHSEDPAADPALNQERYEAIKKTGPNTALDWNFELQYMTPYAKLNTLLRYQLRKAQHEALLPYSDSYSTLWKVEQDNEASEVARLKTTLNTEKPESAAYKSAQLNLKYITDRRQWLETESAKLHFKVMPLLSSFHWEDDAGGQQALNQKVHWWQLTRINRKDLLAALIFGIRISFTVGIVAVSLALMIGIPIGALAGFYAGKLDIIVSRLLEIWESMPIFFMLLMVVSILQSKSIFLVISVIGFFGWTGFSRYIRGEFFKQRNLTYVEACRSQGFKDSYIMFKHILPNAIPPILTLLPFAVMGAISSEAGLSFLGLGEEGSCSWGVLMDEGRNAFPHESYLLWPPAIMLTVLLVAIALVGDALRDTLDPKLAK